MLDGKEIESDTLEVGVFCNGENRGSGRAVYVEGLDQYRVFLTVHGQEGDVFNFRMYDHERGKERRIVCSQTVSFHVNDSYGTLQKPYYFHFNTDYDQLITAEICEGDYYVDHGFHVSAAGTYFNELTSVHGGDSIVRLDLKVNPVFHVEEEVVAMDFPFVYQGVTFEAPGTYTLPFKTASQCDSVWVLNVVPYEGLRELLISPVPVQKGQRVRLFYPFNNAEQRDLVVEVFTVTGNLVQRVKPTRYPIELEPFVASGTYMVKIKMGTGEVITGSIIVM